MRVLTKGQGGTLINISDHIEDAVFLSGQWSQDLTELNLSGVGSYAKMPSNIALIKYMGKRDHQLNQASNPSISVTLPHLYSTVALESLEGASLDEWTSLNPSSEFKLSKKGQERFLNFFKLLKKEFNLPGYYRIYSDNNFPSDCGIASSSSSFASLTMATFIEAVRLGLNHKIKKISQLAMLSKQGSGSSCRSFFKEAAYWAEDKVEYIEMPLLKNTRHNVVLVESGVKEVSSSQAHKLVTSSLLFEGRLNRVAKRIENLKKFSHEDWANLYQVTWAEFWDMHALFETSVPSFGYMNEGSMIVMREAQRFWSEYQDGPLVTMDAGPNVHLLWRQDQQAQQEEFEVNMKVFGYQTLKGT